MIGTDWKIRLTERNIGRNKDKENRQTNRYGDKTDKDKEERKRK